jgi:patatin-related protein
MEEVRVAMALNGGVSLAVWMGGCAVEFDCARRAHAGIEAVPVDSGVVAKETPLDRARRLVTAERPPAEAPAEHIPARRVYNALCLAFSRCLVLDLMSGASAGGINGALLAGAITHGRRLHPDFIRRQWVELGDFQTLLQQTSTAKPTSLMQGQKFHDALLDAFETLLDPGDEPDQHTVVPDTQTGIGAGEVKLDVTTTDVAGLPRRFRDSWGGVLETQEYRARFRFRSPEHYEPALLAQAARASASFPVAFEPWKTSAQAGALAGFTEPRWVVDGGLLDNAPIRAALDLIPSQPASNEVQRYVCYVNADTSTGAGKPLGEGGPDLPNVLGYIANLPRKAPFVDQLTAIEQATRRAGIGATNELVQLVMLDGPALRQTAAALLPAYRRRRRLLSLEDLLDSPAKATAAFDNLSDRAELPWIPDAFPPAAAGWRWGVRAAQRILHLQLDLLRAATARRPLGERTALLAARVEIDRQLRLLDDERAKLKDDPVIRASLGRLAGPQPDIAAEISVLEDAIDGSVAAVLIRLREATEALYAVADDLARFGGDELVDVLFGEGWKSDRVLDGHRLRRFVVHALGIEVVRRAFFDEEDIESAQPLRFVQLTPDAPSPIFATDARPQGWVGAQAKLTGIELGHFSAFYRRSWRVNDFMWGRLDAAARVVEMLVDPLRACELADSGGGTPPWEILADKLVPDDADGGLRSVVHQALGDAGSVPDAAALRPRLQERLKADLYGAEADGTLTRSVCTRLAQLEILGHELPVLVAESQDDAKLGSGSSALDLAATPSEAIAELREDPALPLRLGRDEAEAGSTLALRTMAHAALVVLAMLRGGKLPLANLIYGLRAMLLPIAGIVSRSPIYRLGAVLGFWATALFLTARMLRIDTTAPTDVGLLVSADTLAAVIAVVVVLGVALVPVIRLRAPGWRRRAIQAIAGIVVLGSGGVGAIAAAHWSGNVDWSHVLVAPGSDHPRTWALGAAIALLAGPVVARFIPFAPDVLAPLVTKPWAGPVAFIVLMPVVLIIGLDSWDTVSDAAGDGGWRGVTAWLALVIAPAFTFAYAFAPRALRRLGL